MKLKIVQDFPYFHGGCRRVDYISGSEVDVDDEEMADVAIREGWAKKIVDGPSEADLLAAEEQAKAEAARIAEEQAKAEAARIAEEQAKAEAARIAEEQAKAFSKKAK